MKFDKIIIGAGFYGLYSALFCAKRGQKALVIECEPQPFQRATYVNQARVHQGYHYPRSISTAMKSALYFERFNEDFGFLIGNLSRFMPHHKVFLGQMGNSLKSFVMRQRYRMRKCCQKSFFKRVCVMVHFLQGNIPMMRIY